MALVPSSSIHNSDNNGGGIGVCDLFQSLRSQENTIEERLQLAQRSCWDQGLLLEHKEIYFLRWIIDSNLHESRKSQSRKKSKPAASLPLFWEFLNQLLTKLQGRDIGRLILGSDSLQVVQQTTKVWCKLFEKEETSKDLLSSFSLLFSIIKDRMMFENSIELFSDILDGLLLSNESLCAPAEKFALIVLDGILPIIQHPLNNRKAPVALLSQETLAKIIETISKTGASSKIGSSILKIIRVTIFAADNLKRAQIAGETRVEWLEALRRVADFIELVPLLLAGLMDELPSLQSHLLLSRSTPKVDDQSTGFGHLSVPYDSTRKFALSVISESYNLLSHLEHTRDAQFSSPITIGFETILKMIKDANLYDPNEDYHRQILIPLVDHCVSHISDKSADCSSAALGALVVLLSIDYTLLEPHLETILKELSVISCNTINSKPINNFFRGIFDLFSKSKQILRLLTTIIDATEKKLLEPSTLDRVVQGYLMKRSMTERIHDEIRFSIPSTQLSSIHEMLSCKLEKVFEKMFGVENLLKPERVSKRRKVLRDDEIVLLTNHLDPVEGILTDQDVGVSALVSHYYQIYVIASSRSELQHNEWLILAQSFSNFAAQVSKTVLKPILKKYPIHESKNRFRKWKDNKQQAIVAAAIRVLNSVISARVFPNDPQLEIPELSEWSDLLGLFSKAKNDGINTELGVELIQLFLTSSSSRLALSDFVDNEMFLVAFNAILKSITNFSYKLESSTWNGLTVGINSEKSLCAMWYLLSSAHLSEFSTFATEDQLTSFTKVLIDFGSSEEKNNSQETQSLGEDDLISFREMNMNVLDSAILYEAHRIRESMMETLTESFKSMITPPGDHNCSTTFRIDLERLNRCKNLFDVVNRFPVSYLSKTLRKLLLDWIITWNMVMLSQGGSRTVEEAGLMIALVQHSSTILEKLFNHPNCSTNQILMSSAIDLVIVCFSSKPKWMEENSKNESLRSSTANMTRQIISVFFRLFFNSLDLFSKIFTRLLSVTLKRLPEIVFSLAGSKDLLSLSDELVFVALESAIKNLSTFFTQQVWADLSDQSIIQELKDNLHKLRTFLKSIFEGLPRDYYLPSIHVLRLCDAYLKLVQLLGLGNTEFPINMKAILPLDTLRQSQLNSSHESPHLNSLVGPHSLKLFSMFINLHKRPTSPSEPQSTTLKTGIRAFKALVIAHVEWTLKASSSDDRDEYYLSQLQKQFKLSCRDSSLQHDLSVKKISGSDLLRVRILMDVALTMILNEPEGSRSLNLRCVHRLLNFICLIQSNLKNFFSDKAEFGLDLLRWKVNFIHQICIHKINLVGRYETVKLLEILTEVLRTKKTTDDEFFLALTTTIGERQEIYDILVSIMSHLGKFKRFLILPVFHLYINVLVDLLKPVRQCASDLNNIKDQALVICNWCFPVAINESIDPTNYNRLLIDLCTSTHSTNHHSRLDPINTPLSIQGSNITSNLRAEGSTGTISLVGALSKHAPFYLKKYLAECSYFDHRLPLTVKVKLKEGILVLIGTLGSHEKNWIGRSLVESFNVSNQNSNWSNRRKEQRKRRKVLENDDENNEGEEEDVLRVAEGANGVEDNVDIEFCQSIWKELLKSWESNRYKGID
ncbi:expressed protein [Phakopsora pachyrhizi]|uniref:Expressed protein n=1 Tax=Phakopsora pachyrhizi TaxID=170000 RepID=A0AAV0APW2_PHAPC|nr:expressed protein [Phakopsora pachyrhizi]